MKPWRGNLSRQNLLWWRTVWFFWMWVKFSQREELTKRGHPDVNSMVNCQRSWLLHIWLESTAVFLVASHINVENLINSYHLNISWLFSNWKDDRQYKFRGTSDYQRTPNDNPLANLSIKNVAKICINILQLIYAFSIVSCNTIKLFFLLSCFSSCLT